MMEMHGEVLAQVRGQVGLITLNRPKALNALSLGMVRDLTTVLLQWRADPAVQAVLVQGVAEFVGVEGFAQEGQGAHVQHAAAGLFLHIGIGAGQTAGAELDAAVPADHQHNHLVAVLIVDGGEYRSARGATGFAVVAEAVLLAALPGPAVVRGRGVAMAFDKSLGFSGAGNRRGEGEETALADFLAVLAGGQQAERHGLSLPGVRAARPRVARRYGRSRRGSGSACCPGPFPHNVRPRRRPSSAGRCNWPRC